MSVLVIHWGSSGGGPRFSIEQARVLGAIDFVDVLVSYNENSDIGPEWDELQMLSFPVTTYKSKIQVVTGVFRLIRQAVKLRHFIKKNKVDIVYSTMFNIWQSIAIGLYVPKGVIYVQSVHDAVEHEGDEHWVHRLCRSVEDRRSDLVVTYSQSVKEMVQLSTSDRTPVVMVPLGIKCNASTVRVLPPVGEPIHVGFFGRILPYKGLEIFVEAIRILTARGLNVQGIVRGSGVVSEALIRENSSHIDWDIGWLVEAEIPKLLERTTVLALPYREASQSGVLTLAVGYGIPVVATPVGGLIEQIATTGCGVISKGVEAESFANAIERIISDGEVYRRLSASGLSAAKGPLSFESGAQNLAFSFYDVLCRNRIMRLQPND